MAKRGKPKPISMQLAKRPTKKAPTPELPPADPAGSGPINEHPSLVERRLTRTDNAVENLFQQVKELKERPAPEVPVPVVNIAPRPRITKVTIKYDQLGFPSELIPQYEG